MADRLPMDNCIADPHILEGVRESNNDHHDRHQTEFLGGEKPCQDWQLCKLEGRDDNGRGRGPFDAFEDLLGNARSISGNRW